MRFRRYHPTLVLAAGVAATLLVGLASWQALERRDAGRPPAEPGPTQPPAAAPTRDGSDLVPGDEGFLTGLRPTVEELSGVWRLAGTPALLRLATDGTAQYDDAGRLLGDVPAVLGDWVLRPRGEVAVRVDGGAAGCGGQTIRIRTVLVEPGVLRAAPARAVRGRCIGLSGRWSFEQVLPPAPGLAGVDVEAGPGRHPPRGTDDLLGTWLSTGGEGHLLELRSDRSYTVLSGSGRTVDEGTWALSVPGFRELRLTSDSASSTCEPDDLFVLRGLRVRSFGVESDTAWLAGTAGQDDCGAAWPDHWLRLSD